MAGNITLEVVTPTKAVVNEEVQTVVAPGTNGEFGVLVGHTPFMATLKLGTVRYTDADGTEHCVFISGGFAETLPNKVTILAESAERRCNIDIDRARSALERAQERISKSKEDIDYVRAKAALERALYRIKTAETR